MEHRMRVIMKLHGIDDGGDDCKNTIELNRLLQIKILRCCYFLSIYKAHVYYLLAIGTEACMWKDEPIFYGHVYCEKHYLFGIQIIRRFRE